MNRTVKSAPPDITVQHQGRSFQQETVPTATTALQDRTPVPPMTSAVLLVTFVPLAVSSQSDARMVLTKTRSLARRVRLAQPDTSAITRWILSSWIIPPRCARRGTTVLQEPVTLTSSRAPSAHLIISPGCRGRDNVRPALLAITVPVADSPGETTTSVMRVSHSETERSFFTRGGLRDVIFCPNRVAEALNEE